jgi:hypothetical protein
MVYTKSCVIGTSQEMSLTAGSSIAYINANDDNDLIISTQGSGIMRFYIDGVWRWRMSSSGRFTRQQTPRIISGRQLLAYGTFTKVTPASIT